MKRTFLRLLALFLALCLLPLGVLAEEADPAEPVILENLARQGSPQDLAVIDGNLFAITWDDIFRKVENGWMTVDLPQDAIEIDGNFGFIPNQIASCGSTVYLLGQMYTADSAPLLVLTCATLKDGGLTDHKLLYTLNLGQDDYYEFSGMVADEENLYLMAFCQSDANWGCNSLYRISLADGKATRLAQDYFCALQPYKDGKLMAFYWDQEKAYQSNGQDIMPTIVTLDKQTGAMSTLCSLPKRYMFGLAYDSATDYTYITDESTLYRYDASFAAPERCAYMAPGSRNQDAPAAVLNETYYVTDWDTASGGLLSASTDPAKMPSQVLTISGYSSDLSEMIRGFSALHPEVAVTLSSEHSYSVESLTQQMLSGDDSADIYSVYFGLGGIFSALRDKGYCLDLSGNKMITDTLSRMYPNFTSFMWKGDKLCAVPCDISASSIGYFPQTLETIGLTEEDVPHTLMELMDFCQMWADDYADEYPEYQLFQFVNQVKPELFRMILNGQIALCAAQGVPLTFDTPLMQKLMTKLEEITPALKRISTEDSESTTVFYDMSDSPRAIFSTYSHLIPNRYGSNPEWNGYPLTMSMDDSVEPAYTVNINGFMVNPNSKNAELAISFLAYMMEHLHQDMQIALMPDINEPMESEWYAESVASMQDHVETLKKQLNDPEYDHIDKADMQMYLEDAERNLAEMESSRWAISAEDIAAYREIAPHLFLDDDGLLSSGATEMQSLLQRYMDEQITGDKLIKEMSRILRMIQMEAQ